MRIHRVSAREASRRPLRVQRRRSRGLLLLHFGVLKSLLLVLDPECSHTSCRSEMRCKRPPPRRHCRSLLSLLFWTKSLLLVPMCIGPP